METILNKLFEYHLIMLEIAKLKKPGLLIVDLAIIFFVIADIVLTRLMLSKGSFPCGQNICTFYEYNPFIYEMMQTYGSYGAAAYHLLMIFLIISMFIIFDTFLSKGTAYIKSIKQLEKIGTTLEKINPFVSFFVRIPTIYMASFIVIGNVITLLWG